MEDLKKSNDSLKDLQDELFDYTVSSDENFQDLTVQFSKLYNESPLVHELLLLIYQEFGTREKVNKKRFASMMIKVIDTKTNTQKHLTNVNRRIQLIENKEISFMKKLSNGFTFKNILKSIGLLFIFFLMVATINFVSPETFEAINGWIIKALGVINIDAEI